MGLDLEHSQLLWYQGMRSQSVKQSVSAAEPDDEPAVSANDPSVVLPAVLSAVLGVALRGSRDRGHLKSGGFLGRVEEPEWLQQLELLELPVWPKGLEPLKPLELLVWAKSLELLEPPP
jgi:hypothetical protein